MTVAIVTDSGSELTADQMAENRIVQVPLTVSFGGEDFLSPDEIPPEEFWRRVLEPDCPAVRTAAPSAGRFKAAFEKAFSDGAESVVYVGLTDTLSATLRSAEMAKSMLPGRQVYIVDSQSASMGIGALAIIGAQLASAGFSGAEIAAQLTERREFVDLFVTLDTLEFLRKGGRISAAQATIGGLLSIKPIITVVGGVVVVVDRPRTRGKARERVLELLAQRPARELHILYSPPAVVDHFREELLARMPGPPPAVVTTQIIGPVIGTHVGPGSLGAVLIAESKAVR
jgi:DegV family protein with EDD domain